MTDFHDQREALHAAGKFQTAPTPKLQDSGVVDCPRCHENCGWCGDYRWHHGTMRLPGTRKYCTLTQVSPEGDNCPICAGSRKARKFVAYKGVSKA